MPQRNNREKDRLSELPDDILARILSSLETLDAVRTCVLSKRWVRLWTHITALHVDETCYYDHLYGDDLVGYHDHPNYNIQLFRNFVSMVLYRLATPNIESFSLILESGVIDDSVFETWSVALANKRVKNLSIFYECCHYIDGYIISIRPNVFICHSLVHLSLTLDCIVRVPNFVHLPYLQTLELCCSQFMSDNDSGNFEEDIILSFPILKKLKSYRTWWDVESVSFEVPLLETVEITEIASFLDTCPVNYNVISKSSSDVNTSVSITFTSCHDSEEGRKQRGLRACILLKQLNINQVKHLEISFPMVFSFVKEVLDLPKFNMLRHLKLRRVSGRMLIELLLKSPYLTSLTFEMEDSSSSSEPDHVEKLLDNGIVPDCISNTSNTLKVLKIENFSGHEDQLSLAKYIMENAEHLEHSIISLSCMLGWRSWIPLWRLKEREREEIKEKLLNIKQGLNLTIIDFGV